MSYVFDASSLLILARDLGEKVVDIVRGGMTADLAVYEIGNTLWKECVLFKRLSYEEALRALEFMAALLDIMETVDIRNLNLIDDVLRNASELNITYYDSAYLTIAEKTGRTLVTDDKKLSEASVKRGVKTSDTKALMEKRSWM